MAKPPELRAMLGLLSAEEYLAETDKELSGNALVWLGEDREQRSRETRERNLRRWEKQRAKP